MGKYYYLISGLPELQLDDQKLKYTLGEYKIELNEQLSLSDRKLLSYYFMQFDNINLLRFLNNQEADFNPLGDIDKEMFSEIFMRFKETDNPTDPFIYDYFKPFIPAYLKEEALNPKMSWDDLLSSLYFDYAINCKNEFISEWFSFNLNITNIITAVNCLKFGFDRESSIVGSSEISEEIRNNNSRDFGIAPIFPEVEEVMRIAEEEDIYERERKIDLMKWNWLEEKGFFHYFDVEHLFIYLIKMQMLSRWVQLEKETGLKIFREMIDVLQHSFEFPNEFTVRKVAGS